MKFRFSILALIFFVLNSCSTSHKVSQLEQEPNVVHKGHSGKHKSCSLCNPRQTEQDQLALEPIPPIQIGPKIDPSHLAKKVKPEEIASPEKKAETPAKAIGILKKSKEISETLTGDIKNLTPKKGLQVLKNLYEVNPNGTNKFALWGFILSLIGIAGWAIPYLGGLIWTAGLVLSIIGLVQINRAAKNDEYQKGKGFAIAGIVISALQIVLLAAAFALVILLFL